MLNDENTEEKRTKKDDVERPLTLTERTNATAISGVNTTLTHSNTTLKCTQHRAAVIALRVRAPAHLAEDPGLVPSNHMVACNHL